MTARTQTDGDPATAHLEALGRVVARVTANADQEGIFTALASGMVEEFGVALACIWLYDPADEALELRGVAGADCVPPPGIERRRVADLPAALLDVAGRHEALVADLLAPDSPFPVTDTIRRLGLRGYAAVPLLVGGRLAGGVELYLREPWPPPLLAVLTILAQQAALALSHTHVLEESHALQSVAAELASTRDPEVLLEGIVARTTATVGADACAVWLFDGTSEVLRVRAARGFSAGFFERVTPYTSRPGAFSDLRRGSGVLHFPDLPAVIRHTDPAAAAAYAEEGIVSSLRLPLFDPTDSLLGLLALYHRRERHYSPEEIRLAQAFADQIAVAHHNARASEEERQARDAAARQVERLTALRQITRQLLSTTEPSAVLDVVAEAAWRLSDARGGALVGLINSQRTHLTVGAYRGPIERIVQNMSAGVALDETYLTQSATGQAIACGRSVVVEDYRAWPPSRARDRTIGADVVALLVAPLRVEETTIGVLVVNDSQPRQFTPEEVQTIEALADQAALAIEHARLLEESHTLQALAAELATTREPASLLESIVERAMTAFDADGCAVWLHGKGGHAIAPVAARGVSDWFLDAMVAWSDAHGLPRTEEMRRTRRPVYTPDAEAAGRARDPRRGEIVAAEGIVSSLMLPLFMPGGDVAGILNLYHRHRRRYSEGELRLAQAFADQIAVALHNAELATQEQQARAAAARQLDRLTTLTQITQQLLAEQELDAVLQVVVQAASRLCGASGAMVGLIDEGGRQIAAVAADGEPRAYFDHFQRPTLDDRFLRGTATGRALRERRAVAVENYTIWESGHPLQAETVRLGVRAFIVAPLLVEGAPIGVLWVNDTTPRPFAPEDVAIIEALADQAALAIEHARLLARSREAAVLEERARLARDLHDSVTQSVFSVGLMTNAALGQYERGIPVEDTLRRIKAVSQDALAEMRALLYELHPAALAEEGLAKALAKLVAAMQVRVEVPIAYSGTAERRLGPDTETAIFRIVQEALGNAAKYAQATALSVTLLEEETQLQVEVQDNGMGFDPRASVTVSADGRSGGMGLRSMRARAAAAGLGLQIVSSAGAGTRVRVTAPLS